MHNKKMLFVVFSVLVMLALVVSPVGAVTDGEPDGDGHPGGVSGLPPHGEV